MRIMVTLINNKQFIFIAFLIAAINFYCNNDKENPSKTIVLERWNQFTEKVKSGNIDSAIGMCTPNMQKDLSNIRNHGDSMLLRLLNRWAVAFKTSKIYVPNISSDTVYIKIKKESNVFDEPSIRFIKRLNFWYIDKISLSL